MFQWNWDSVAKECTDWLGPRGFGYAQVSPPEEHITGAQWSSVYAPVSYEIGNKLGTRDAFAKMVKTCNNAGVGVLADVVLNHSEHTMAEGSGTGIDGSSFGSGDYPAVPYTSDNFHAACDIDYSSESSIRTCTLDSLPDLKTESAAVQKIQTAYLNDLISMGVSGFRVDAAMWMDPTDLKTLFSSLTEYPYLAQEVSWSEGNPVTPQLYTDVGNVHEFRACFSLTNALIDGGGVAELLDWPGSDWIGSSSANVFAANHDTERSGWNLNYTNPGNAYTLAQVAQPYGTPSLLSGFNFTTTNDGAPIDSDQNVLDTTCWESGWRCEQRWPDLVNMVAFHNAVSGTTWNNKVSSGSTRISFGRGSIGHVAINSDCEIIDDTDPSADKCAGTTVVVKNGAFSATAAPYKSIAIYTGALASSS
ncbi:hypothetical protein RQP46_005805 [Phenoliferia psychrophenolica]